MGPPANVDRRPSTRGVAAGGLRRHNLSVVLEHLHHRGPASRSQLTAVTGLNRSTIGGLIAELSELGFVRECAEASPSGPGRPSPIVEVDTSGGVALAVELAVDSIAAAAVGLGGRVIAVRRQGRRRDASAPSEVAAAAAALCREVRAKVPQPSNIVGTTAAVAGITDSEAGVVHHGPNLGWRDVPLSKLLTEALGFGGRVTIANEADLGAIGELRRGAGRGHEYLLYVSGEVGIGCGVIQAGRLMTGSLGHGAEAGHAMINPSGGRCRCGAVGCWESEAGEMALLRRAGLPNEHSGIDALTDLFRLAQEGEPTTVAALEETGRWLGLGVANLVNIFNPEIVVLGGLYQRLYRFLAPSLTRTVAHQSLRVNYEAARVCRSQLGEDAPLIGAAEHVFDTLIADPAGKHP